MGSQRNHEGVVGLYDIEDDEDLEPTVDLYTCEGCEEQLLPELDDIALLQVSYIQGYEHPPMIRQTEEGEPLYEPLFYCFRCYEELLTELRELNKDQLPGDGHLFPLQCEFCGRGVGFEESYVSVSLGEIVRSKRYPDRLKFQASGNDQRMCLSCAVQLSGALDDEDETASRLWQDMSEHGECARCTFNMCWRAGGGCSCGCHWRR